MDLKLEMQAQAQFSELAALDRSQGCRLCGATGPKIGIGNLKILSEWWLAPVQRSAWDVTTLIQGRQAHDLPNMDAVFKIATPLRNEPIPVFLVICQHHKEETKRLPHYQAAGSHRRYQEEPQGPEARDSATVQ